MEIVNILIDHKADVNLKNINGSTPLHFASENGFDKIVEILIKKGKADVNLTDNLKFSALHFASAGGFTNVVNLLMADPNIVHTAENEAGLNSYDLASSHNQENIMKLLHPS
ncbi:hypothetical protein TRFO_02621 [Tritrichomonas foetus]|uniref:Uncharacterized protein n=1 Tax=Tritrichomonas foetus TaxID=1144522 RepID=A0A1J4L280_9EUKA|nr:hypothetical protein TRFO_02621 [Tritrichomonas foetus]|eukprot:OHT17555.1 hypothetical protein TRFO_02621 [Tritrichomonas foetus]